MTPHEKLMEALEAGYDGGWHIYDRMRLDKAFDEYRAAPKPLVLEPVNMKEIEKENGIAYYARTDGVLIPVTSAVEAEGQCYRLPDET